MSGHSKWSQIKRTKGAKDVKRGVLFSKLSKRITVAAKAGGSADPNLNYQLRTEIDHAKAQGMPNDNIDRAAKKAFGTEGINLEEVTYEGYGPFGSAFLIAAVTDNKNRTVQNIKRLLDQHGGSLGTQGSVAWQFQTTEPITIEPTDEQREAIQSLYDALEDDEDVANIRTNVHITS